MFGRRGGGLRTILLVGDQRLGLALEIERGLGLGVRLGMGVAAEPRGSSGQHARDVMFNVRARHAG